MIKNSVQIVLVDVLMIKRKNKMKKVYLDNAATTKVDEKVLKEMLPFLQDKFGNASSQHRKGHEAKRACKGWVEVPDASSG